MIGNGNGAPTGQGDLLLKQTPPKDLEAERCVLGAVLVFPEALDRVRPRLAVSDFYLADHGRVFGAAIAVSDRGEPVTTETVLHELRGPEKPADGFVFDPKGLTLVLQIQTCSFSLENTAYYVGRVRKAARARSAISVVASGLRDLSLGDQGERDSRLTRLREELDEVSRVHEERKPSSLASVMARTLHEIGEAADGRTNAVPTGIGLLDDMTGGGFRRGEVSLIAGRPATGKCLAKGTMVLMADGIPMPVELVQTGDRVMGPDGSARRVQSVVSGVGPLFRVQPKKGDAWVCNEDHVLTLVSTDTVEWVDVGVSDWFKASQRFRGRHKQFSVGVNAFEDARALPVDDYFLGLWFGDGDKEIRDFADGTRGLAHIRVTKPDPEVRAACQQVAEDWGLTFHEGRTRDCPYYTITTGYVGGKPNALLVAMREVVGPDLRVPRSVLCGPRSVRLQFLAGFLDADAELSCNGFVITQKREDWARAVWRIARSLGFCATIRTRTAACQTGAVGTYFVVTIGGATTLIPTRIPRKKAVPRTSKKDATRQGITITPAGVGEWFGFTLSGDGRFLLEDFTVTHNSTYAVNVARKALEAGRGVVFFALEMPAHLVNEILLCSVGRLDSRALRRPDRDRALYSAAHDVAERVESWPLEYVSQDDEGAVSVVMIRDRVRRLRSEGRRIDLVIVDYLQILVSPTQRRERQRREEVEEISRALKRLAVELDLPLVVTAQFNRQAEEGKPKLSQLRESGALEQDAALVLALHLEDGHENDREEGPVKLLVLKNRYGPPGEVDMVWHRPHRRFDEPAVFPRVMPPVQERPRTGREEEA